MKPTKLAVVIILSVAILTGCLSAGARTEPYRVAVILQESPYEFWTSLRQGIESAADEFHVQPIRYILTIGPMDQHKQIAAIKRAVDEQVDAILLAPFEAADLDMPLQQARDAGIPVISIHTQTSSELELIEVSADHKQTAEMAIDVLRQSFSADGQVLIVNSMQAEASPYNRKTTIMNELVQAGWQDKVETLDTNGDKLQVMNQVAAVLKAQSFTAIIGICEECAVGAALAVRDAGQSSNVTVIGFDSTESELRLLEEGLIDAIVVQNAFAMGYISVKTLIDVLDNGMRIDGPVYVESLTITSESLQFPEHQKLLYPFEGL